MKAYIAQSIKITGYEIKGPLQGPGGAPVEKVSDIVSILLNLIYPLAGVLLFLFLVWGGYDFLMSGGNAEKIKSGQAKITSAIIGFILLVLSYFVVKVISYILGLNGSIF